MSTENLEASIDALHDSLTSYDLKDDKNVIGAADILQGIEQQLDGIRLVLIRIADAVEKK